MNTMDLSLADKYRKEGNYEEALPLYLTAWENTQAINAAWGSIHCLRKRKRIDEAEVIALKAIEKYPDNVWVKRELVWVLYDKEIKPAKEMNDLGRLTQQANRILQLGPEEMPYGLIVKAVVKVAKLKGKWDLVLQWVKKIDPIKLSPEESIINGRKAMSEKEVWYISKTRALFELEQYKESREEAQNGLEFFPDSFFLKRLSALALAKSGDVSNGISELRAILNHPKSDWYLKSDIAELSYEDSHTEDAYRLVCESLIDARQGSEYKLSSFLLLARLAVELKDWNVAVWHIALSKAVRNQAGWKVDSELESLESRLSNLMKESNTEYPQVPGETKELEKLCRQSWFEGMTKGMVSLTGIVKPYSSERHFTFIKADQSGEDIFVWIRDLPPKCTKAGSRVSFILKKSFDKKKAKDTFIAGYIRCI